MSSRLRRSISEPIREGLSWDELWKASDEGLIWCWERGRQERDEKSELAARVEAGELVPMDWKGGVEKKMRIMKKFGTLKYLATWQGLRGQDLDIAVDSETTLVCSRTGQVVVFTRVLPDEE